jgi:hypothetical protein
MKEPPLPAGIEAVPIPGYPRFRISRDGTVWSYGRKGGWFKIKPYMRADGVLVVGLTDGTKEKITPTKNWRSENVPDLLAKAFGND